jgi:hypothetical protein
MPVGMTPATTFHWTGVGDALTGGSGGGGGTGVTVGVHPDSRNVAMGVRPESETVTRPVEELAVTKMPGAALPPSRRGRSGGCSWFCLRGG